MDQAKLDEYLRVGKRLFDGELTFATNIPGKRETLDDREGYKAGVIEDLARARDAVLAGDDGWASLVVDGLAMKGPTAKELKLEGGQLSYWQSRRAITQWIDDQPKDAWEALRELWAEGDTQTDADERICERLRAFVDKVPLHDDWKGLGTRLREVSVLLTALPEGYPPFKSEQFNMAYKYLGYDGPSGGFSHEGQMYKHALDFLDLLLAKKEALGFERPWNRRDAQSLVWTMHGFLEQAMKNGNSISENVPEQPDPLTKLGKDLLLKPESFLSETVWPLLKDKKQIIFQGPPGTGKTYVAQKLAEFLAGSEDRVELVQFHPSYAYEDFVQGFRPTLEGDRVAFELRDGPLIRLAQKAQAEAERACDANEDPAKFFLIIDEINRGNLAKVFGELYFLLEYRGPKNKMRLQYSNESDAKFWMPENLYIIGTMNTADRSIALVDAALRRRFYFVPFHPNEEPIKGLLKEWLEREAKKREAEGRKWSDKMAWLPGVVDAANKKLSEKLGNEETAIGPSYFMKGDIPEKMERVWKYNVLPYIEEQLYDQRGRVKDDFALKALKEEAARVSAPQTEGATAQGAPDESAPDGGDED